MDSVVNVQIEQFFDELLSFKGVLAVSLFLIMLVVMRVVEKAKWVALTALLYVVTLGRPWNLSEEQALIFPLEHIRVQSRVLCFALMILLIIPAIRSHSGWRARTLILGTILYFVFQIIFSITLVAGGDDNRGVFGGATHVLIFLTLGWGLSRWLESFRDIIATLRCVVAAAALFCLGTIWQLVNNQSAAIQQDRLIGTAGNAQAAAVIIAASLLPAFFLLVRRSEPKRWRVVAGVTAGLLSGMLLWTGSRTGALMSLVGLALFFRLRAGKLLLGGMVAGMFALLLMNFFADSSENLGRFTDATDTRTQVWRDQWNAFLSSPVTGGRLSEQTGSENSYLNVASRAGLVGLVPLLAAFAFTAIAIFRANRLKSLLGDERMLVDLLTGGTVALAVGAVFEGYFVGIYSFIVFLLYIYLSLLTFSLDWANAAADESLVPSDPINTAPPHHAPMGARDGVQW